MQKALTLLAFLLFAPTAWAACPATPADCPSPAVNNLAIGGTMSGNVTGTGKPVQQTAPTISGLNLTGGTTGNLIVPSGAAITFLNATDTAAMVASAQNLTNKTFPNGYIQTAVSYDARSYGSCTWDATHDVGSCINSALAAAASAGGGTVTIPAGEYGLSTAIVNHTSGVKLAGQGTGMFRDNNAPTVYSAVTKLTWIGAADATMATISRGASDTVGLYAVDVTGIVFNCADLADICLQMSDFTHSVVSVGVSEPRVTGFQTTTVLNSGNIDYGNQMNDIWVASRSTLGTHSPTGIDFGCGASVGTNTSYNRIHQAIAWYNKGDGIVFSCSDNNLVEQIETFPQPGATGTPVVYSNNAYAQPNGITGGGFSRNEIILHAGANGVVKGLQSGSTITAGGGNVGSGAVTTVTISTNGTTALGSATLNFASTTGVATGMVANCTGGWGSGVPPNAVVRSVTATTVVLRNTVVSAVASSLSCTFSYGVTNTAVSGTYTITATGAATFNITAPAGGTSETGIAYGSGKISFSDVVIPFTGTPTNGDTWTMVLPSHPSVRQNIFGIDKENSLPDPFFEVGSSGWITTSSNAPPIPEGGTGNIVMLPAVGTGTLYSTTVGGDNNSAFANVYGTTSIGGGGNIASGFASTTIGGGTNTASGTYSIVTGGFSNTSDGTRSRAGGSSAAVRTRYGTDCWGGGQFAAVGDAQSCVQNLRGTGASASAFSLTADGAAAGATNCVNLPNNSAYAITITIIALDHTTVSKNETWLNWGGLLTRGANAASTALTMQSTPTPLTNGTVTGSAIAASADTTNGCLTLQFTPPTGNTDTWNAVARVTSVEVK